MQQNLSKISIINADMNKFTNKFSNTELITSFVSSMYESCSTLYRLTPQPYYWALCHFLCKLMSEVASTIERMGEDGIKNSPR